jgi:hypothetical protein
MLLAFYISLVYLKISSFSGGEEKPNVVCNVHFYDIKGAVS